MSWLVVPCGHISDTSKVQSHLPNRVTILPGKSWKVTEFSKTIFQTWKVMENSQGHGKSWKMMMMMSWNFFYKNAL